MLKVVDFTQPFSFVSMGFIQKSAVGMRKTSFQAVVLPFNYDVWLGILATYLIMTLCLFLLMKPRLRELGFNLFGSLVRQPLELRSSNVRRGHWMIGLWLLFVTFAIFAYSSMVLSALTVPLKPNQAHDMSELAEFVRKGKYRVIVSKHSSFLKPAIGDSSYLQVLAKEIKRNKWYSQDVNLDNFFNEYHTALLMMADQDLFLTPTWAIESSNDRMYLRGLSVVTRKGFCGYEKLNSIILRLNAAGIYNKLKDHFDIKYSKNSMTNSFGTKPQSATNHDGSLPLSLLDVSGSFHILLSGHAFAFLVFLGEIIYFHYKSFSTYNIRTMFGKVLSKIRRKVKKHYSSVQ